MAVSALPQCVSNGCLCLSTRSAFDADDGALPRALDHPQLNVS